MISDTLSRLPKIATSTSPSLVILLRENQSINIKSSLIIMNIYAAFNFSLGKKNYTGLDILNDAKVLNLHITQLVGFIYSQGDFSLDTKCIHSRVFLDTFTSIAKSNNLSVEVPKLHTKKLSYDVERCIETYLNLDVEQKRLGYLNGWQVVSKDDKAFNAHLGLLHDIYGEQFTQTIYEALCHHANKHKEFTAKGSLAALISLLDTLTKLCPSLESLMTQLNRRNSYDLFEQALWQMLSECITKEGDVPTFFQVWGKAVKSFNECFIETGIFDEPVKPFLTPSFKEPKTSLPIFATGGQLSPKEEQLWLADIPLEIKDEEVINLIDQRLKVSEEHVREVLHKQFLVIKYRNERNREFIKTGRVKPMINNNFIPRNERIRVGRAYLANTVATFFHYGIKSKSSRYNNFLYNQESYAELAIELNLPTTDTLMVLCTLLVLEHPILTPSALQKWQLFDKHGNQTGLIQSGENWVIVVNKDRKGASKAQQEVILNDYSLSIVRALIEHTAIVREYFKANPDLKKPNNWRYVLLTATITKASRPADFNSNSLVGAKFRGWVASHASSLTQSESDLLAASITLRSARRIRAIRTYIKTQSSQAVSDLLGHQRVRHDLLDSYLPDSLRTFFYSRWIRQFQNSFIYLAMKESDNLFEAIDITPDKLEEFLNNHRIRDIPKFFEKFKNDNESTEVKPVYDGATFTVTVPLLQVLICIRDVVDNTAHHELNFKDIVETWYQAATLILTDLELKSRDNQDLKTIHKKALQHPLDSELIKGAMTC